MAADVTPADLVPFRWPAAWTDPQRLSLLEGGPFNCLLLPGPAGAVAEAARKAKMSVIYWNSLGAATLAETKWDPLAPIIAINGLVWPRIQAAQGGGANQAQSGPTGAPWIDSNSWVARLAAARAPAKQIWLAFEPPKDEPPPSDTAYRVAIADAAATGARWPVALHEKQAAALAAGSASALKIWRAIFDTLTFFEKRKAWRSYVHQGPVGAISTFAGDNEFLGTEFLNLAARRNLLYRIFDRSRLAAADFSGLRALVWLDPDQPPADVAPKLAAFARDGGLLIVSRNAAAAFKGDRLLDCAVAGYELRALGKGSIASATREWDDPYFLAADVHNLVSRRYDPVRMFNGSSYWVHYSAPPRGGDGLIQLVSFGAVTRSGGAGTSDVSLRIAQPHSSVMFHALEAEPAPLAAVTEGGVTEYRLPQFSTYAALEVKA
jgi:hypothetical protein